MPDALVLPIRNGLQLTITGEPSLRALASFLKAATIHFKNQRDIQRVAVYTAGSFQGRAGGGDCAISNPGDQSGNHLSPAAWADAVIEAHQRIEALEEIRQNLSRYKEPDRAVGRITTIVETLERPSPAAHLDALRVMLESPPD